MPPIAREAEPAKRQGADEERTSIEQTIFKTPRTAQQIRQLQQKLDCCYSDIKAANRDLDVCVDRLRESAIEYSSKKIASDQSTLYLPLYHLFPPSGVL
jgi:hypothetical protein